MKVGYTHITFVLDRSGSMGQQAEAAKTGFEEFVQRNLAVPGEATLKLVLFNHDVECRTTVNLTHAQLGRYVPDGMTALLDAVGQAIVETGAELAAKPESERPERVLFCVLTDGLENSSQEFSRERLAEAIRHQRETYGWVFLYLAAGLDAWQEAREIGVPTLNYAGGVGMSLSRAYGVGTQAVVDYRSGTKSADAPFGDRAGNV